jgi:hypothetical protein
MPQPGPQTKAYFSEAFEVLYGGEAGTGKSDLLLGVASEHHNVLILRRTFPELESSIIPRSQEIYGNRGRYNESKHVWKFTGGHRIQFGHLENEKSIHQYQSAAYDYIGFDELTQFTKLQYLYLFSRCRSSRKGQRKRMIGATNPGGIGNDWVIERWAAWLDETHPNPAKPGELRWYKADADGKDIETTADDPDGVSRTFIPAKRKDNAYLGPDYERVLNLLPEPYRSQLKDGSWTAGLIDDAYQVCPRVWVKAAMARWTPRENPGRLTRIGEDVARGGDDKTVLAKLYREWFDQLEKHPGITTPDGHTGAAILIPHLIGGGLANIDVIGVGASVYDVARGAGLKVIGVNFANRTDGRDGSGQLGFANVRAEAYWRLREALDPNSGIDLALPPDPELLGDLVAPRWRMSAGGIQIEDKEDIKKRIGRSPDCGDAVVLAWYTGGILPKVQQLKVDLYAPRSNPITTQTDAPTPRSDQEINALLEDFGE